MMLVIRTQLMENYAWVDGEIQTGQDAYWKCKGGSEYKVLNVPHNVDFQAIVNAANVERADDYFIEMIMDWSLEADDYLSWFEKSQLEYDGAIACPEPTLLYADVVNDMILEAA